MLSGPLGLTWEITKGVLAICVALIAFHVAKAPFQTIVIAALALIYVNVLEGDVIADERTTEITEGTLSRFVILLRALNHPQAEEYADGLQRVRKENQRWIGRKLVFAATLIVIAGYSFYEIARTAFEIFS